MIYKCNFFLCPSVSNTTATLKDFYDLVMYFNIPQESQNIQTPVRLIEVILERQSESISLILSTMVSS